MVVTPIRAHSVQDSINHRSERIIACVTKSNYSGNTTNPRSDDYSSPPIIVQNMRQGAHRLSDILKTYIT